MYRRPRDEGKIPWKTHYSAIWWPIGFAVAAAYFVFVSRRSTGKVRVKRDNQGFY
jgi:hypothetical protein